MTTTNNPAPTQPETLELLPCPFCGSHAHVEQNGKPDSYSPIGYFTVCCVVCDATIDYRCNDQKEATERWNTRAPVAERRHYFCSCGGACTAEEYIVHYFELGHDRAEDNPSVGKFIATIADGLRHAIRDHGDITKERIGSAAKRVWGRIRDTRYDPFRQAATASPTPAESVVVASRVVNISTHGEPTRARLREIQASAANGYESQYRKSGWSKALQFALEDLHFLLTFFRDDVASAAAPADNDAESLLQHIACSGVEFNDNRLGYVSVQIDRDIWEQLQAHKGDR